MMVGHVCQWDVVFHSVETLLHKVETVGARKRQRMATDVISAQDPLPHGTPHIEGCLCRYRASAG